MKLLLPLLAVFSLLSFSPNELIPFEDTETFYIEEEFVRHDVSWWSDSIHHPQEATFFVEVPSPDPFKNLSEIKLEVTEFLRHHFSAVNISSDSGIISTEDVWDTLTVSIRGISGDNLILDNLNLIPQSVHLDPYSYIESPQVLMVRLASGSIIDGVVLDEVEDIEEETLILRIQFNSIYDVVWTPHNLWFLHKLILFSGVYGEFTYVYK
jgi:hypothetical protein